MRDRIGTEAPEGYLKAMPHTRHRNSRIAARSVSGFVLSLAIVIALLLPALPAAAAPGLLAALDLDCAAASASDTHCASMCQPAVRVSADEQTPSYFGGGFVADGYRHIVASAPSTGPSIRFLGRSSQRIYLRYHRLLL